MKRLLRLAERLIDAAAILVFSAIFLCVFIQVILRYVFNSPMTWSEELARYLFIWCAFLGWVIASRHNSHLAVNVAITRMGPRTQAGIAAVTQLATLLFAWVLGTSGARLVANNWDVENVAVPFNLGVVYLIEPVAAVAICAYALLQLAEALRSLRAAAPPGSAS